MKAFAVSDIAEPNVDKTRAAYHAAEGDYELASNML